jgi:hypothetical protein
VSGILGKLLLDASGDTRSKIISLLGMADRFKLADTKADTLL